MLSNGITSFRKTSRCSLANSSSRRLQTSSATSECEHLSILMRISLQLTSSTGPRRGLYYLLRMGCRSTKPMMRSDTQDASAFDLCILTSAAFSTSHMQRTPWRSSARRPSLGRSSATFSLGVRLHSSETSPFTHLLPVFPCSETSSVLGSLPT